MIEDKAMVLVAACPKKRVLSVPTAACLTPKKINFFRAVERFLIFSHPIQQDEMLLQKFHYKFSLTKNGQLGRVP